VGGKGLKRAASANVNESGKQIHEKKYRAAGHFFGWIYWTKQGNNIKKVRT
jgi:hypothetical protein